MHAQIDGFGLCVDGEGDLSIKVRPNQTTVTLIRGKDAPVWVLIGRPKPVVTVRRGEDDLTGNARRSVLKTMSRDLAAVRAQIEPDYQETRQTVNQVLLVINTILSN